MTQDHIRLIVKTMCRAELRVKMKNLLLTSGKTIADVVHELQLNLITNPRKLHDWSEIQEMEEVANLELIAEVGQELAGHH